MHQCDIYQKIETKQNLNQAYSIKIILLKSINFLNLVDLFII